VLGGRNITKKTKQNKKTNKKNQAIVNTAFVAVTG